MHLSAFLPWAFAATASIGVVAKEKHMVPNHCLVEKIPKTPEFFLEHGSQRITTRYGVQTVPSAHDNGGMLAFEQRIPPPCNDCLVTFIQAGLEYPNGTSPDADTVWLHHTVFSITSRTSAMCRRKHSGDWFFASGNERTPINLCLNGASKTGYYIGMNDEMAFSLDLMNMKHAPQEVIFTMTWEYIPGNPSGFDELTPYWLDVGGCGSSSFPAHPNSTFSYSSPTWKADFSGRIVTIVSHLHDGGTHLEVKKNGETVCDAEAQYDDSTGHIASISTCTDGETTARKDKWSITAHYNTSKHTPMSHMGKLEPVMGISMAYVVKDKQGSGHKHHHFKSRWLPISAGLIFFWAVVWLIYLRRTKRESSWFRSFSARRDGNESLMGKNGKLAWLDAKYADDE